MADNRSVGGFILGAAVGAGLALLLAPMAGGETRRHIGGAARKLKDGAVGAMENAKGLVHDGASGVHAAIESGKDAFRWGADKSPNVGERS